MRPSEGPNLCVPSALARVNRGTEQADLEHSQMPQPLPVIYLARHGETEWSLSGQHTGLTDLPLTAQGEQNARQLGPRLACITFAHVFTSPLQRAAKTCELTG